MASQNIIIQHLKNRLCKKADNNDEVLALDNNKDKGISNYLIQKELRQRFESIWTTVENNNKVIFANRRF